MRLKISTQKLVYMAFFSSLSIILTRFASFRFFIGSIEGIRIGFGGLPIVFSGILFGPAAGAIVGGVSDVLGFMLDPVKTGTFLPQITAVSILRGLIPPLVLRMFGKNIRFSVFPIVTALTVESVVTSIILMPLILYSAFGIPVLATIIPRIISQIIQVSIYTIFILILFGRVRNLKLIGQER
ncbi:MAG: riboflavin transporter [Thermosediminibacterales bacterium]|nr:riboflavin transporter [Thermosediminibacterales bacterium]